MALLFFDGCQWGASGSWDGGWDTTGGVPTYSLTGPFGDRFIGISTNMTKTFGSNVATLILGYWWNHNLTTLGPHYHGRDGTNVQFRIEQTASPVKLQIRNGSAGTILGTTTATYSPSVWRWVEWKIPLGNSVTVICKVDGAEVLNVPTVDTTTSANNFIDNILCNSATSLNSMGCIVMCDATGSSQNDFLGPQRASVLLGTGADTGTFNTWTASTSTRTSCVDESPTPNGDTDYISDNTAGHQQSFTMTDLPVTPSAINGLSLHGAWRRDDAGPHTARLFLRNSGGTIVNETTESIPATFETKTYQHGLSIFSSAAWTKAEIDGLQAGVELVS